MKCEEWVLENKREDQDRGEGRGESVQRWGTLLSALRHYRGLGAWGVVRIHNLSIRGRKQIYLQRIFVSTNTGRPSEMSMQAKSLQTCPTLCNAMGCSLPVYSVHVISQARILEWVAMPFSRGSSQPREGTHVFCISHITGRLFIAETQGKPNLVIMQP